MRLKLLFSISELVFDVIKTEVFESFELHATAEDFLCDPTLLHLYLFDPHEELGGDLGRSYQRSKRVLYYLVPLFGDR